jgi:hypothetical protein
VKKCVDVYITRCGCLFNDKRAVRSFDFSIDVMEQPRIHLQQPISRLTRTGTGVWGSIKIVLPSVAPTDGAAESKSWLEE